jgi:hypothetical protein
MGDDPGSPEEAAAEMVNGERLLPGEPRDSNYAEDARYWTKVYRELIDTKSGVLEETRRPLPTLEEPAADEIRQTDLVALSAELDRFSERLHFWEARLRQLDV